MIVDGFRCNKADLNYLNNSQQSTIMDETKESASTVGGKIEKVSHQEDRKSLPSEFEKYEETSHDNEEYYLENSEYHSKTHYTIDMDHRACTDGRLNCEGVPTDWCSQLYVGDIEIIFENIAAYKFIISINMNTL